MLITNFKKEKRPLFEKAIRQYGREELYIDENAYWENGYKDESLLALRCSTHMDLSDFWKIFNELKNKTK